MKHLFTLFLCLFVGMAFASSSDVAQNEGHGIVTPNVATTVWWTYRVKVNSNGDLVVCQNEDWYGRGSVCEYQGRNMWARVQDTAPKGRTYVGFKIVPSTSSTRMIEIYYK